MNIIDYALHEIRAQIPPQLLEKAYSFKDSYGFQAKSVEDYIRSNILECRVLTDCNILGGMEMYVETTRASNIKQVKDTSLYTFEPATWKGNGLISVTDFRSQLGSYGCGSGGCTAGGGNFAGCSSEGTMQQQSCEGGGLNALYGDALKHAQYGYNRKVNLHNIGGSSLLRVIGDNTIGILNTQYPPMGVFTVIIGHDKELRDMGRRDAIYFSRMAVAAVKADIYNTVLLTLGQGDASRGFILTSVSDVINSYSDEEAKYQELRLGWGARAFEADPLRMDEFINDQISPLDIDF